MAIPSGRIDQGTYRDTLPYRPDRVKISPQKLIIWSFACQQQAAHIYNRTIEAIDNNETCMVAYRYLQSRQGICSTCTETTLYALFTFLCSYIIYCAIEANNPTISVLSGFVMIIALAHLTVDYRNTWRYHEINSHALQYLKQNLEHKLLKKIKRLEYDQLGTKQLCRTLSTADIATSELTNHLRSKNQRPHIA